MVKLPELAKVNSVPVLVIVIPVPSLKAMSVAAPDKSRVNVVPSSEPLKLWESVLSKYGDNETESNLRLSFSNESFK